MRLLMIILVPFVCFAVELSDMGDFIEVEILPLTGMTIVGMEYTGTDPAGIMQLWTEFMQRVSEIPGRSPEDDAYGVLLGYDQVSGEYSYLAGVESGADGPLPEGMVSAGIDPGPYAVFTFRFDMLESIYSYVYDQWMPQSGWAAGEGYSFEFYPEDFIPSEEGVLMQLYVSVREEE
ncbi:MAG: GyrI-like domain-containing protein [Candidatus Fermentibacteraceae bacterium]|nr:GyrI-like domain-containing protein [Candidatus Fermentibacteraceae bacterium]MBN2608363.1 GyrI-like domain-containing protein [Candidatus Fermentibacteraceae bacterium]